MVSPTLVAIGDNCLDVFVDRDIVTVGGNALNVAVNWRRAGWNARYFGAVGDDPQGALLLDVLAATGLDPADVEKRPGQTAVTLIRAHGGEREFLEEGLGVGERYSPSPDRYAAALAAAWVHLGTNASPELVQRLLTDGVRFSLDLSTHFPSLPLAGVPLVFASAPIETPGSAESLLRAIRAAGAQSAVVTCGAAGAWFDDGKQVLQIPALPVEVVDTCGAGDSFIAAFLAEYWLGGCNAQTALQLAVNSAAATCRHLGGFPQTPRPRP